MQKHTHAQLFSTLSVARRPAGSVCLSMRCYTVSRIHRGALAAADNLLKRAISGRAGERVCVCVCLHGFYSTFLTGHNSSANTTRTCQLLCTFAVRTIAARYQLTPDGLLAGSIAASTGLRPNRKMRSELDKMADKHLGMWSMTLSVTVTFNCQA